MGKKEDEQKYFTHAMRSGGICNCSFCNEWARKNVTYD